MNTRDGRFRVRSIRFFDSEWNRTRIELKVGIV